jgi:hypothetical protein
MDTQHNAPLTATHPPWHHEPLVYDPAPGGSQPTQRSSGPAIAFLAPATPKDLICTRGLSTRCAGIRRWCWLEKNWPGAGGGGRLSLHAGCPVNEAIRTLQLDVNLLFARGSCWLNKAERARRSAACRGRCSWYCPGLAFIMASRRAIRRLCSNARVLLPVQLQLSCQPDPLYPVVCGIILPRWSSGSSSAAFSRRGGGERWHSVYPEFVVVIVMEGRTTKGFHGRNW